MSRALTLLVLALLMAGCAPALTATSPAAQSTLPTTSPTAVSATATRTPAAAGRTATATAATASPTPNPADWQDWAVIPAGLSPAMQRVFARGQQLGRDPRAFSKVGDCETRTTWFLWEFDQQVRNYSLGDYEHLQRVVDHFQGSFSRLSLAASFGYTAATVQTPLFADHTICLKDESPLACEYRVHNPAFALITLGTNDAVKPESFEPNLRRLIEFTKADNLEKDHANNATLARMAAEYELPLWNFWLAVQPLPRHGLQKDGVHLTFAAPYFDDPWAMQQAWPVRNLTALQVLEVLMVETNGAGKQ